VEESDVYTKNVAKNRSKKKKKGEPRISRRRENEGTGKALSGKGPGLEMQTFGGASPFG